jgi:molybdopterin-containing oxidoreductase family membrane subunit
MKGTKAVVGVFSFFDDTLKAIENAKAGSYEYRVYSPFANHHIEDATLPGKSPIRFVTATGAVIGLISGFSLAILCSMDWPMRTSAKDVVSVPAFVVIGYECTILFGAIATLLAMFHFCRLPDILRKVGYDPRFSDDKFGVVVSCGGEEVDTVVESLKRAGADEVEVRDAL